MKLLSTLTALAQRFSALQWWSLAIVLGVIRQYTQVWLDGLYNLSGFPVPFFVGQTTFDAVELKGYYAVMLELETLNRYFWVQIADYAFMFTVLISFIALMAAVYRSLPTHSRLLPFARAMLIIAPMAAVFDALENAISFFMIANPTGFADWLVYPYSTLAVAKFAVFGITYLWAIFALIVIGLGFIYRKLIAPKGNPQ